jgi:GcrA cell cycle regulator
MPFNIWPQEHSDALRTHVEAGRSFAVAASEINYRFGTSYTRNAAIGRAQRMGLCSVRPRDTVRSRRPPPPPRPKPEPKVALPPRPRREILELRCAEVEPGHFSILDLGSDQCRYPYGDRNYTFCGHVAYPGSSYCEAHLLLCTKDKDHPRAGKPAPEWLNSVRKANVPKALALSSGDWEQA